LAQLISDLQDDRTDNPAQDEDGAGEVVPDDVDERVVHFKELLPSQIVSCCPEMKNVAQFVLVWKYARSPDEYFVLKDYKVKFSTFCARTNGF
jgi:hypothetical protein